MFFLLGQCFGGTETYEKTTGVKFSFGTTQGILTQPGTGITRDCTAICRQTPTCAAFTVGKHALLRQIMYKISCSKMYSLIWSWVTDYENSRCQSYNMDSTGHRNSLHDKIGSNYFEKICLRGGESCGWNIWHIHVMYNALRMSDFV